MKCPVCGNEIKKVRKNICPTCGCKLKKGFSLGALLAFLACAFFLCNVFLHWLFALAAAFAFASGVCFLLLREYKAK